MKREEEKGRRIAGNYHDLRALIISKWRDLRASVLDSSPAMPIRHPDHWLAGHVKAGECMAKLIRVHGPLQLT